MTLPAVTENRIPAMSIEAIEKVRELEFALLTLPQVEIATDHVLHGGMYARTVCIPAGVAMTGVFIRVPTLLVFQGNATLNAGEGPVSLTGLHVIAGSSGRKQAIFAHEDSSVTMVFATHARTIADAEEEFTDEAHLLFSRKPDAVNTTTITGE